MIIYAPFRTVAVFERQTRSRDKRHFINFPQSAIFPSKRRAFRDSVFAMSRKRKCVNYGRFCDCPSGRATTDFPGTTRLRAEYYPADCDFHCAVKCKIRGFSLPMMQYLNAFAHLIAAVNYGSRGLFAYQLLSSNENSNQLVMGRLENGKCTLRVQ